MKLIYCILLSILIIDCDGDNVKDSSSIQAFDGDLYQLQQQKSDISSQVRILEKKIKTIDSIIYMRQDAGDAPSITVMTVNPIKFEHYIQIQGSTQTDKNLIISSEYSGKLKKMYFKGGEFVKKGTLLANVDDGELAAQFSQAKVRRDLSKTVFERQKNLWEQNVGSEIQYLKAKTDYQNNQKICQQYRVQLKKTRIIAPFSGVVDDIITKKGSFVSIGTPIIRLISLTETYVKAYVPESYLNRIKKGAKSKVYIPVFDNTYNGAISKIEKHINPTNRSFFVKISLENVKELQPNLTVRTYLNDYTNPKAIMIPRDIISKDAKGKDYIFQIKNLREGIGIAKKIPIKLGKINGNHIEVIEGISQGAMLVNEGARSISDSQKVRVIDGK